MFVHTVYFTMTDEAKAGMDEQIEEGGALLRGIETVRHLWSGKPVPSERPVVVGDYDYAVCVVFDDQAGHDVYQTHANHLEFLKRYKATWAGVEITDFA